MKGFRLLVFFFFAVVSAYPQDMQLIDNLKKELEKETSDTVKVRLLGDISWQYRASQVKKAMEYAEQELALAERINYKYGLAKAHILMGVYHTMQGEFSEAVEEYQKSKKVHEERGDSSGISAVLFDIGNVYLFKGDYDEALDYFLQSLRIEERHGTKQSIAEAYINIGDVYGELGRYDEALKYYFKYLEAGKEGAKLDGAAEVYNNIGKAYSQKKLNDSALYYLNEGLKIANTKVDKTAMANSYTGIGHVYLNKKDYKNALDNYNRALQLNKEVDNPASEADVYGSIANAYIESKDYKKAYENAEQGLKIALGLGTKEGISNAYLFMAQADEGMGKYKEAYDLQEKFFAYKDSMLNETNNKQIVEMQTRFETEKKEAKNQLLELQVKRDRFFKMILIAAIFAIIFIAWLLYSRHRAKQKELLQTEMLKQQELRSKAVIEAEEQERMRIAKELHDGIGQTLSAVKMNMSTLENSVQFSDSEQKMMMQNAIEMVDDSVKEVRSVSHNMMPNALIRAGLAKAVREFINKLNTNQMKIDLDIVGLEERLDQTVETVLYRVIQENVSNIIKHSKANHVNIQLIRHDHELITMIEDNGVGFDTANIHSFEGIGLKNIQSRIEYLKGNVTFDSTPGKGTIVTIEIPLSS